MLCFYHRGYENIIYKLVHQSATWLLDDLSTAIEEDKQTLLLEQLSDQSRTAMLF